MTVTDPAAVEKTEQGNARAEKMLKQLGEMGLEFDAATGSVVPGEGIDISSLPSSVALNGAADGQGRFYSAAEFMKVIKECDDLLHGPAKDEKKPFQEKYKAREELEKVRVNIETKRCLAMIESNTPKKTLLDAQKMVARVEYRLGTTALAVEEGSGKALEHLVVGAMPQFFGQDVADLVEKIEKEDEDVEPNLPEISTSLPLNEAVDLLNTCGAANANREKFKLSVQLLKASERLYDTASVEEKEKMEDVHTQTLFFLAQTWGHLGDASNSSLYCAKTTYRQLRMNVVLSEDGKEVNAKESSLDVEDWTRNVMTLANYYASIGMHQQAEHCLQAAGHLAALFLKQADSEDTDFDIIGLRENVAQIDRKRAETYLGILNLCAETHMYKLAGVETGDDEVAEQPKELIVDYGKELKGLGKGSEFMKMNYKEIISSVSYEFARKIFLAANAALERALKFYVFDGFVTDHIDLCLVRANAYGRLSLLESDEKRKQAMQLKRVQSIEPIMEAGGINEEAFCGLLKTLVHEIGAAYMDMHELKSERIEGKIKKDPTYRIKAVEAKKMNDFAWKAMRYFTHFLKLYFNKSNMPKGFDIKDKETWGELCVEAGKVSVEVDEVLGYLGAHFKIARLLSKIVQDWEGEDLGKGRMVKALEGSFERFEYVGELAEGLGGEGRKDMKKKLEEGFAQQVELSKEMARLLPVKISRVIQFNQQFVGAA
ncbi:hypothetical protein TrLO_g6083 [Triparma laevis f. longispina]|uniref:KIF-binding protein n=1 Tax=Triparma laevis f. longispina TaxID=1714387 RepID=A0A9W7FAJ9_9STRA|nr:hypothetical protein TrLO_g6083 [Triparma laevis f. longispina]